MSDSLTVRTMACGCKIEVVGLQLSGVSPVYLPPDYRIVYCPRHAEKPAADVFKTAHESAAYALEQARRVIDRGDQSHGLQWLLRAMESLLPLDTERPKG